MSKPRKYRAGGDRRLGIPFNWTPVERHCQAAASGATRARLLERARTDDLKALKHVERATRHYATRARLVAMRRAERPVRKVMPLVIPGRVRRT